MLNLACRSVLFNIIIDFLSFIKSNILKSSSLKFLETSKTAIIKSEESTRSLALSTPIFSTKSSVSLIPAVSIIFKGIPSILTNSSITSRVVPGISVTIALFSFKIAFNKDDLPTFGLPNIRVFNPSLNILPLEDDLIRFSISSFTLFPSALSSS